ncbi:MAG: tetratricopeptide repeat protein, partial [Acidimicrobiales bacterium]
ARGALAWSLFRAGQVGAAWEESRRATALGTRDPLLRFQAAEIAATHGRQAEAADHLRIVLATNPRFSARHAPRVEALARELGLRQLTN